MKISQKLILLSFLMCLSALSLHAENKQQVFVKNVYGQDVVVDFTWKSKNSYVVPYKWSSYVLQDTQEIIAVKAPISGYHLTHINVTPATNVWGKNYTWMGMIGSGAVIGAAGGMATVPFYKTKPETVRKLNEIKDPRWSSVTYTETVTPVNPNRLADNTAYGAIVGAISGALIKSMFAVINQFVDNQYGMSVHHNHGFFVIQDTDKSSKTADQNKIVIHAHHISEKDKDQAQEVEVMVDQPVLEAEEF